MVYQQRRKTVNELELPFSYDPAIETIEMGRSVLGGSRASVSGRSASKSDMRSQGQVMSS